MRTLNLGILAHVDAGKTSLTERLLFTAGVIPKLGSVDAGNTQTDSLELERERGITIKAAVVSFSIGSTVVNLVDTPGHPDFIAEVERALGVLDAAVVVVSAVEGVQAQTRVLVRALRRLNVPFVFFVNKIDRLGARYADVVASLAELLQVRSLAMSAVLDAGSKQAQAVPCDFDAEPFRTSAREALAENDEALLLDFVLATDRLTPERLRTALADQVAASQMQPAFGGSATTGTGIAPLMDAIEHLLPAQHPDPTGPVSGRVFKIDRGWGGEKQTYLSLTSGTLHVRDDVELPKGTDRIIGIQAYAAGKVIPATSLQAGQIGRVAGLASAVIGDLVGTASTHEVRTYFAPPILETRVLPRRPSDSAALWTALSQLSEQDPLINLRHNEDTGTTFVSLYGEVQKEVIGSTLAADFGLGVEFLESTVICVERVLDAAESEELIFRDGNPFFATVGLRIEPRPEGTGNTFALDVNTGLMPTGFYRAVEETVHDVLRQGAFGWQIIDCHVTMIAAGQRAPITTAADFRLLAPLVLAAALAKAKTAVCEPINRFYLDLPPAALNEVLSALGRAGAAVTGTVIADNTARLDGVIAASAVGGILQQLPRLTGGIGAMECAFHHYAPVAADVPIRQRSGLNPFDRTRYLSALRRPPK